MAIVKLAIGIQMRNMEMEPSCMRMGPHTLVFGKMGSLLKHDQQALVW